MVIPGADDAARLAWLARHRLWPMAGFLAERSDLPAGLASLAEPLAKSQRQAMRLQAVEDRRVVSALSSSVTAILVLKGALLAQTVYPTPESRFRTDLDLLVDTRRVAVIEEGLSELGYKRIEGAQSAMPLRQSQWTRKSGKAVFAVDLHWDLRNHPALQNRFSFDELIASSQPLPALGDQARGMGSAHALLNASMHFFNDYADERPQQWLLDKDLLWRSMSLDEQAQAMKLACDHGLAGLLAESLNQARGVFATPVSEQEVKHLRQVGSSQWRTGLIKANKKRRSAYLFALWSEPGTRRKLVRIRKGLFPPPSYLRSLYPEGSRFGVVGLYFRRLLKS